MEEFFSPRGGATQVKNILQGFGVNINKMDGIIQKVTAKACQEAESVRAIFPARVYAIYLQESKKLSITNIHIQDKTTSVEFTLN